MCERGWKTRYHLNYQYRSLLNKEKQKEGFSMIIDTDIFRILQETLDLEFGIMINDSDSYSTKPLSACVPGVTSPVHKDETQS